MHIFSSFGTKTATYTALKSYSEKKKMHGKNQFSPSVEICEFFFDIFLNMKLLCDNGAMKTTTTTTVHNFHVNLSFLSTTTFITLQLNYSSSLWWGQRQMWLRATDCSCFSSSFSCSSRASCVSSDLDVCAADGSNGKYFQ